MDTTDDNATENTDGLGGPTEGGNPVSADDTTHTGQDHATPGPSTHDIGNAIDHAPQFQRVIEELQSASRRASFNPGSISRYDSVNVKVITWENDDLRVRLEADRLKSVFANLYGFNVHECCLPSHQPSDFLSKEMHKWVRYDDCVSNLFIVYYAGHCYLGPSREVIWANLKDRKNEHYAEMKWSVCEERLHDIASDTLFLLDCCFAAGAAIDVDDSDPDAGVQKVGSDEGEPQEVESDEFHDAREIPGHDAIYVLSGEGQSANGEIWSRTPTGSHDAAGGGGAEAEEGSEDEDEVEAEVASEPGLDSDLSPGDKSSPTIISPLQRSNWKRGHVSKPNEAEVVVEPAPPRKRLRSGRTL